MTVLGLVAIAAVYGIWAVLFWMRWSQVRKERDAQMLLWVEFIGGSKDGDREAIPHGMTRWTVTRLVPILAPHWSRAEDDPTDLYRVQVVGWYERQGTQMAWRAA